ncbi:MAG: protein kinase [Thermoanaerobaculia bacterium]
MIGTTLSHYKITAKLGEGGMGEVFVAEDSELRRKVALKVLPQAMAVDSDRLERFKREARSVAALNHPNIVTIYSVEEDAGVHFLTMELVEGKPLSSLLSEGGIPYRDVVAIALALARALTAAHGQGIVHRDLKPANVMVGADGGIKVLDFGLAKLQATAVAARDSTGLPTLTMTQQGVVMGTAPYMSPEQVRGEEVDHRSDLFSFGSVLYEMLTGRRAFQGDTAAETMTAVLRSDPPPLSGPDASIPLLLAKIVERCLAKNTNDRFQSATDLAFQLETLSDSTLTTSGGLPAVGDTASRSRKGVVLAVLASLGLGAIALLTGLNWRGAPPKNLPPQTRTITYSGSDSSVSASPDGRLLAFVSMRDGVPKIWLKRVPDGDEVALTEGPDSEPRISPDGSEVLFGRNRGLYRVSILGGSPRKLVDDAGQADWSPDGERIVFVRGGLEGAELRTIGADGSGERFLYRAEGRALAFPRWSPDGSNIASSPVVPGANVAEPKVLLVDVESGSARTLAASVAVGQPFALTWSIGGEALIYAQPLNQTPIAAGMVLVRHDVTSNRGHPLAFLEAIVTSLDILSEGVLVVGTERSSGGLREWEVGDGSEQEGHWLTRGSSVDRQPAYSPDGKRVIFSSNRTGNLDLWEISTGDGTVRRLTDHPADDWDPAYSVDGRDIIWSSDRGGNFEIWIAEADGRNPRQVTNDGFDAENPSMTADGEWIVYNSSHPEKGGVWKIRPDGKDATHLAAGATGLPEVSPDGRHIVFSTQITSSTVLLEVVRIEDGAKVPFRISCEGDAATRYTITLGRARWLPDGKGIAFVCGDGGLGIYRQDFRPGTDTRATRRVLVSGDDASAPESFGISPDGRRITVAEIEILRRIETIANLYGVTR